MIVIADGERARRWRAFALQKMNTLRDFDLTAKVYEINGYRIKLLRVDGVEKAWLSAPPYTSFGGGFAHFLMVDPRGRLWSWGFNTYGQLGTGDTTNRLTPVEIAHPVPWAMVARGDRCTSSFAIRKDGTLWAWGRNTVAGTGTPLNGVLGLGAGHPGAVLSPTQLGSERSWAHVASSENATYGVKTDGTLWVWGWNIGYLGIGPVSSNHVVADPVRVGADSDWRVVSASTNGAMAIKADGTLWAVGQNRFGALGLGDVTPRFAFAQVGTDRWATVRASFDSAFGVKADGTLWATGDMVIPDFAVPPPPSAFVRLGTDNDWVDVAGDNTAILAVKRNGEVYVTGYRCDPRMGEAGAPSAACATLADYTPMTKIDGVRATVGGVFATGHTAMVVDPSSATAWWGVTPGDTDATAFVPAAQALAQPQLLPAIEPLAPPWY